VGKTFLIIEQRTSRGRPWATLVVNKLRGTLHHRRGEGPRFRATRRKANAGTSRILNRWQGHHRGSSHQDSRNIKPETWAKAKKVSPSNKRTTPHIVGGEHGKTTASRGASKQDSSPDRRRLPSDYDRRNCRERLAKLSRRRGGPHQGGRRDRDREMKEKRPSVRTTAQRDPGRGGRGHQCPGGGVRC